MIHVHVLDRLVRASPFRFRRCPPAKGQERPRRLLLETLEDRNCPSQVTVSATATGYWDQFGKHIQTTQAYETGIDGRYEYHSFFIFDLSNVSGTITDATLVLENPATGFQSNNSPLTLGLVNVDTPVDQLTMRADRTNPHVEIWQDLGGSKNDNEVYGTYDATSADNSTLVNIPLTDLAVADLNGAEGQSFAIGGSITNLDSTDNPQEMFGDSRSPRYTRELVLTIADQGPRPPDSQTGPGKAVLAADDFAGFRGDSISPTAATAQLVAFPATPFARTADGNPSSRPLEGVNGDRSSTSSSGDVHSLVSSAVRHDAQDVLADGSTPGPGSLSEVNSTLR